MTIYLKIYLPNNEIEYYVIITLCQFNTKILQWNTKSDQRIRQFKRHPTNKNTHLLHSILCKPFFLFFNYLRCLARRVFSCPESSSLLLLSECMAELGSKRIEEVLNLDTFPAFHCWNCLAEIFPSLNTGMRSVYPMIREMEGGKRGKEVNYTVSPHQRVCPNRKKLRQFPNLEICRIFP